MLTKFLIGKGLAEPASSVASDEEAKLRAEIEDRDAAIRRLEQTIAEQNAQISALEDALEQAKFQTGILEQSYSTQLRKARERAASAEKSIVDQGARTAELEVDVKKLNNELAEARAKLGSWTPDAASIDELLDGVSTPQKQTRLHDSDDMADNPDRSDVTDDAEDPDDPWTSEDMLAPDVMFAGKSK